MYSFQVKITFTDGAFSDHLVKGHDPADAIVVALIELRSRREAAVKHLVSVHVSPV